MKISTFPLLGIALAIETLPLPAATVTILKNGSSLDGSSFLGGLTVDAHGTLYGASTYGGVNNLGAFFSLSASGSGFNASYDFNTATGSYPVGSPILGSDGKLYGATYGGGTNGNGVIYAIAKDGSGSTVLHNLTSATEGNQIYGPLIEGVDGKLYGTATIGGTNNNGTLFRIRKDGTGFAVLRQLTAATDGSYPYAGLTQDSVSGRLYGTTIGGGGGANGGTVFSVNSDGTDYTVLKAFSAAIDGTSPYGQLLLVGNILYGTTYTGGANGAGVIFRIKTDGTGFAKLHEFDTAAPGSNNGYFPYAGLALGVDGQLYGTTYLGGSSNYGTLFSLSKAGSGFQLLHTFTGQTGAGPGAYPYYGSLLSVGPGRFVGTTYGGGANNSGTIFALTVPVPKPTVTITKKPPATTKLAKFTFKGAASGPGTITRVEYQIGTGAFKPAAGKASWSFTVALKKGKNVISVRAVDSLGQKSAVKKVTTTRR